MQNYQRLFFVEQLNKDIHGVTQSAGNSKGRQRIFSGEVFESNRKQPFQQTRYMRLDELGGLSAQPQEGQNAEALELVLYIMYVITKDNNNAT